MNPSQLENAAPISNQSWSINNSMMQQAAAIPMSNATIAPTGWPASYDYYGYYQNVQPGVPNPSSSSVSGSVTPATTSTASSATLSTVDYSKAWDEYCKAYYGKTYAEYAASQYPGYTYEQIAAYNAASYQTTPQQQSYYTQAHTSGITSTIVTSALYSNPNQTGGGNYGYQVATTNWNQPPPDYNTQYSGQNLNGIAYSQASSINQYDSYAHVQNNNNDSKTATGNYFDASLKPQPNFNNATPSMASYTTSYTNNTKYNNNYYNRSNQNENENGGRALLQKENGNKKEPELSFTDRYPRPQFDVNPPMSGRGRGGRFRQPLISQNRFNNDQEFRNRNDYRDEKIGGGNNFSNNNFRGRGGFRAPLLSNNRMQRPVKLMEIRPAFNNQPTNYNDHRFSKPNDEISSWADEDEFDSSNDDNKSAANDFGEGFDSNNTSSAPKNIVTSDLLKMDIVPSRFSQVISRRQQIVDNWQAEVSKKRLPSQAGDMFETLKQLLSPDMQGMLQCLTYLKLGEHHCELILEDIFLTYAHDKSDDVAARQIAALRCWEMLQNRVFVMPITRQFGDEYMPGFCISTDPHDIPLLPPIHCSISISSFGKRPPDAKPQVEINCWDMQDFENDNGPEVVNKEPVNIVIPQNQPTDFFNGGSLNNNNNSYDIFLLLDESNADRDYNIATLQNTAKFNEAILEFKHEKKPLVPHISQCIITMDGKEIGRSEARDYLVAKRQAAEETLFYMKKTHNLVGIRLDEAKFVLKSEIFNAGGSIIDCFRNYFTEYMKEPRDIPLRFGSDFTSDDKSALMVVIEEYSLLSSKTESLYIYVYREFPVLEVKHRLLTHGFCGQYRLIEKVIEQ